MKFLDTNALAQVDARAFQSRHPFPWMNPHALICNEGFEQLRSELPELSLFKLDPHYARDKRAKNRWELFYEENLSVPGCWRTFIAELSGPAYGAFIKRLFGEINFRLRFQWHFCADGFYVLPHCDSAKKLASHLFYLNTSSDWRAEWGGETLLYPNNKPFDPRETRAFEDFPESIKSNYLDNYSLIWSNTPNSWHSVETIHCPDDAMRKLFTVIIEKA